MENSMFWPIFAGMAALCAVLVFLSRQSGGSRDQTSPDFRKFRMTYLGVYCLMVAGDWLQGPYIYALYDAYGFPQHDIAVLFVAGFGSSFVLGTYIGSMADRFGRKRWALLYVITYVMSCVTKHFNHYWILMVGRILGGISTSLLFSVFESWLIKEHNTRQYPESWLGPLFSTQMFLNSVVAIVSGVAGQLVTPIVDMQAVTGSFTVGGFCAPFDVAICCLLVGGVLIDSNWKENYGDASGASDGGGILSGLKVCVSSPGVLLTGIAQSLFEGSMYTFVFMWTPALTPDHDNQPPYGLIFSTLMVCAMMGSTLFGVLLRFLSPESMLAIISFISACALSAAIFTSSTFSIYMGFLAFEFCVGIYFPCMSTLKSTIVPEAERSTVYSLFRVPLNAIVVVVLLWNLNVTQAFKSCTCMLLLCTVCGCVLVYLPKPKKDKEMDDSPMSLLPADGKEASDDMA